MPFATYFFAGPKAISALALFNIFIFFGVPIFALLMTISRRLFKKSFNPRFQAGIWALWLVNAVSVVVLGMSQVREFNREASFSETVELPEFNSDTIYLKSLADPSDDAIVILGELKLGDDELISNHIHVSLERSTTGEFELSQEIESRGSRNEVATQLARAINYQAVIDGNTISFPSAFSIPKGSKWRGQQVHLVLKVPDGKTVKMDHRTSKKVWHFDKNDEFEQPWVYGGEHYWTMEKNGFMAHEYLKKNRDARDFDFTDYEDIQIEGMVEVDIKQGDTYSIEMFGKSKYTKQVEIVKVDKLLNITTDMNRRSSAVKIEITLPKLNSLDVEDTDDVRVTGFTQKEMLLKASGRNEVKAIVNVDQMTVKQNQYSKVGINGKGSLLKATLNDNVKLDTEGFAVKVADMKMERNARAEIAVSDTIRTYSNDHGHHHLRIDGEPVVLHDGEVADLSAINIDH